MTFDVLCQLKSGGVNSGAVYWTLLMYELEPMSEIISTEEVNRMRWAARRGMLELDLVLEPFVSQCYATLGARDRERFQDLMLCEDQDLFAWLLGRTEPADEEIKLIVGKVLEFTGRIPADR